jgi:dynein heavy chain
MKEMGPSIQKLGDKYIEPTLNYIKKNSKFLVPITQISMIISLCRSLKIMVQPDCKNVEYIFVFAWVWACAAGLTEKDGVDYRKEFSNWWKGEWKSSVKFPAKGSVFDYFVDQSGDGIKFEEWAKRVETIDFDTQKGH